MDAARLPAGPASIVGGPLVAGVDPPVSWRVWAYVTGPEFPDIAGAFVDVLVEGPWQQRAFAAPSQ